MRNFPRTVKKHIMLLKDKNSGGIQPSKKAIAILIAFGCFAIYKLRPGGKDKAMSVITNATHLSIDKNPDTEMKKILSYIDAYNGSEIDYKEIIKKIPSLQESDHSFISMLSLSIKESRLD
jgi:hypothetical protein